MEDSEKQAIDFLQKRYKKPLHTVAAAIRTKSDKVYLGTNIDHFSGYVCAETSALAMAMNAGETEFVNIVAVRREPDGTLGIANPCGKCRQILHDYTPNIKVLVRDQTGKKIKTIEELLPYSFQRQKEKIQEVLNGEHEREVIG